MKLNPCNTYDISLFSWLLYLLQKVDVLLLILQKLEDNFALELNLTNVLTLFKERIDNFVINVAFTLDVKSVLNENLGDILCGTQC